MHSERPPRADAPSAFDVIRTRFNEEFGPSRHENKKLVHWELLENQLAVILLKADRGTVIVPFRPAIDVEPYLTRRVDPPRAQRSGRHSNIAARSKSVGWTQALLYLDLWTYADLEATLRIIRIKQQGKPLLPIELEAGDSPSLDGLPILNLLVKRAVYRRDKGKCVNCGSEQNLHFDHDLPRERGGDWSLQNVRLLCRLCNLKKSNRI